MVDKVRKAIEMRYGLVILFEFWDYEVTCFEIDTNSCGIFAEYVNVSGIETKLSANPSWVQSEDDKDKYINFQKRGAKEFGETEIELVVRKMGSKP